MRTSPRHHVYGVEVHRRPLINDYQGHRIVHHGKSVTLTSLSEAGPLATQVKTFATHYQARTFTADQVDHLRRAQNYSTAFEIELVLDPADPRSADQAFEDAWSDDTYHSLGLDLPDPRRYWVLFANLESTSARSHGMAVTLNYLRSAPHCSNTTTNQTIGLVGHMPRVHGIVARSAINAAALDIEIYLLGERTPGCAHGPLACTSCEFRQAELIEFLCRGQDIPFMDTPERIHLVCTARRLVASGHRSNALDQAVLTRAKAPT